MREEGRKEGRSEVLVTQSCPALCDPMDCSQLNSSVHGIFQARILEWIAIPFSEGSSQLRDWTWVFCIAGIFFTVWAPREALKGKVVAQLPICVWLFANPWTPWQHARPPCPSPSPRVHPSSCPLHRWCHPAISSSDTLFSFCPQSFPAPRSFPMSQLFTSDDQNAGASASALVLLMSIQGWFPLRLTGFVSFVQGTLRSLLQHHSLVLWCSAFLMVQVSQQYVTGGKTKVLTIQTFVSRVMSLLFNILSRFIIAFLPRSNHLISWLQSPSTVILEYKKKKSVTSFTFSPSICHEVIGLNAMIFSSVQFSYSVMSDSLWPHGLQHARSPCPSPTPGVYSTHVHWVIDAMQPSHPLLSPSPPTFNLSQHQSLFKWVSSLHQVVKVLEFQLQHQSFQWIFGTDL